MFARAVGGILVMLALGASQPGLAADALLEERYTVFVELPPPYKSNRAALLKMLNAEGYRSHTEGEREITLALTEAEIKQLFQARIVRRTTGASATDRMIRESYLEGARIPARFEKLMRRVYLDPQRG